MLGALVVVLAFRLPRGRQPVTARGAHVKMSDRQDADSYLKRTIDQASGISSTPATDDAMEATRDPEPPAAPAPANMASRIDGRLDDPAEMKQPPLPQAEPNAVLATTGQSSAAQPPAAQSQAYQAGPPAAQSQAYQAALDSGPPAGAVPVAYPATAPGPAYQDTAYDRFMRAQAAPPGNQASSRPVVVPPGQFDGPQWSSPATTATEEPSGEPALSSRAVRVLGPIALFAGAVAGTLVYTSASAPAPITFEEVVATQREWGDAIIGISKTYLYL